MTNRNNLSKKSNPKNKNNHIKKTKIQMIISYINLMKKNNKKKNRNKMNQKLIIKMLKTKKINKTKRQTQKQTKDFYKQIINF